METVIELKGLTKRYNNFTAVHNLDLTINKGEVFGLLGPNGAGKSTTILMMLGLTEPNSGMVKVCGLDATRDTIAVKKRIGYLPDDVGFYDQDTGMENLLYTARLNQIAEDEAYERAKCLLERVGLSNEASKKTGKYSRGMRQRLGLADVLIKNPEIIILDEPTLGIDPQGVREFLQLIVKLSREEGITVLLSSHHLHQVQQVCDRVGIFVGGRLLACGDLAGLSDQLFRDDPLTVTLKVKVSVDDEQARLLEIIRNEKGVSAIHIKDDELLVACRYDITTHLARTIVTAGFGLLHLNQKAHGLDEIYQRYFEGGTANG